MFIFIVFTFIVYICYQHFGPTRERPEDASPSTMPRIHNHANIISPVNGTLPFVSFVSLGEAPTRVSRVGRCFSRHNAKQIFSFDNTHTHSLLASRGCFSCQPANNYFMFCFLFLSFTTNYSSFAGHHHTQLPVWAGSTPATRMRPLMPLCWSGDISRS